MTDTTFRKLVVSIGLVILLEICEYPVQLAVELAAMYFALIIIEGAGGNLMARTKGNRTTKPICNSEIEEIFKSRYGVLHLDEDGVPMNAAKYRAEGIEPVKRIDEVCKDSRRTSNTVSDILNNPVDYWQGEPKLRGWVGHRAAEMRAAAA